MYRSSVTSIHIHRAAGIPSNLRLIFCAVVESLDAGNNRSALKLSRLTPLKASSNNVQVSVLVNVGEIAKKFENVVDTGLADRAIVRLNALDECKRRCGEPRKLLGEFTIRHRQRIRDTVLFGDLELEGKLTLVDPSRRKADSACVALDNGGSLPLDRQYKGACFCATAS
jgi:hypothetical protein